MSDTLHIVWTSAEPEVAHRMVFMYAENSRLKGWWENVHVIIWGPSVELLSKDLTIQASLKKMQEAGVEISACRRCAETYGLVEFVENFGDIEVIYIGESFTHILKSQDKVLTF